MHGRFFQKFSNGQGKFYSGTKVETKSSSRLFWRVEVDKQQRREKEPLHTYKQKPQYTYTSGQKEQQETASKGTDTRYIWFVGIMLVATQRTTKPVDAGPGGGGGGVDLLQMAKLAAALKNSEKPERHMTAATRQQQRPNNAAAVTKGGGGGDLESAINYCGPHKRGSGGGIGGGGGSGGREPRRSRVKPPERSSSFDSSLHKGGGNSSNDDSSSDDDDDDDDDEVESKKTSSATTSKRRGSASYHRKSSSTGDSEEEDGRKRSSSSGGPPPPRRGMTRAKSSSAAVAIMPASSNRRNRLANERSKDVVVAAERGKDVSPSRIGLRRAKSSDNAEVLRGSIHRSNDATTTDGDDDTKNNEDAADVPPPSKIRRARSSDNAEALRGSLHRGSSSHHRRSSSIGRRTTGRLAQIKQKQQSQDKEEEEEEEGAASDASGCDGKERRRARRRQRRDERKKDDSSTAADGTGDEEKANPSSKRRESRGGRVDRRRSSSSDRLPLVDAGDNKEEFVRQPMQRHKSLERDITVGPFYVDESKPRSQGDLMGEKDENGNGDFEAEIAKLEEFKNSTSTGKKKIWGGLSSGLGLIKNSTEKSSKEHKASDEGGSDDEDEDEAPSDVQNAPTNRFATMTASKASSMTRLGGRLGNMIASKAASTTKLDVLTKKPKISKWTGVKGGMDFINRAKAKAEASHTPQHPQAATGDDEGVHPNDAVDDSDAEAMKVVPKKPQASTWNLMKGFKKDKPQTDFGLMMSVADFSMDTDDVNTGNENDNWGGGLFDTGPETIVEGDELEDISENNDPIGEDGSDDGREETSAELAALDKFAALAAAKTSSTQKDEPKKPSSSGKSSRSSRSSRPSGHSSRRRGSGTKWAGVKGGFEFINKAKAKAEEDKRSGRSRRRDGHDRNNENNGQSTSSETGEAAMELAKPKLACALKGFSLTDIANAAASATDSSSSTDDDIMDAANGDKERVSEGSDNDDGGGPNMALSHLIDLEKATELEDATVTTEMTGAPFLSPMKFVQLTIGPGQFKRGSLDVSVHKLSKGKEIEDGIEVHHMEASGKETNEESFQKQGGQSPQHSPSDHKRSSRRDSEGSSSSSSSKDEASSLLDESSFAEGMDEQYPRSDGKDEKLYTNDDSVEPNNDKPVSTKKLLLSLVNDTAIIEENEVDVGEVGGDDNERMEGNVEQVGEVIEVDSCLDLLESEEEEIAKQYQLLKRELEEAKARELQARNEVRVLQQEIQKLRTHYSEVKGHRQ